MVDGEGLQPVLSGVRLDVAEAVGELLCSAFYFSKNTFDSVPIPVRNVLKSEAVPVEGGVEPRALIDETRRPPDVFRGVRRGTSGW